VSELNSRDEITRATSQILHPHPGLKARFSQPRSKRYSAPAWNRFRIRPGRDDGV